MDLAFYTLCLLIPNQRHLFSFHVINKKVVFSSFLEKQVALILI